MCDTQAQSTTESTPQSLAEIVREVTDNGRIVVEFLADMVLGKMEGATYSHRLEAARQLEKLGLKIPHVAVIEAAEKATKASKPRKQSAAPAPAAPTSKISELAEIVRLETDNGKDIVRFLVDVVQGNHEGFKEHHRLRAAIELRRCLTDVCDHTAAGVRHDSLYNHEDDPFDFDNYDEEQFMRDRDGERVLRHIYGSEEAITTVREAVARFRKWVPLLEEDYVPDRDFTPTDNPEKDPDGKGHYAYNALRFIFDDNRSIRVANRIYEKFKNIEDNTFKCSNHDHPDWSRDYALKTIRESLEAEYRALYEQRQPPQNPDPHVVLSEAEGSPSPDHARPSTEHNPDHPNVILERSEESPSHDPQHTPTQPTEEPPAPAQSPLPAVPGQPHDPPVPPNDTPTPNVILDPPNVILSEAEGSPSPDHARPSTEHNPDRPHVILERSEESPAHNTQHTPTEPTEEPPAPAKPLSTTPPDNLQDPPAPPNVVLPPPVIPEPPHVILSEAEESPSRDPQQTPPEPNEGSPSREHAPPSTEHNPDRPHVILERSEEPPSHDPQQTPPEPTEEPPAPSEPPSSVTPEPTEKLPKRRRKKIRRIIHLGPASEEDPPDDYPRRRGDPDEIRVPLRDVVRYTAGPL